MIEVLVTIAIVIIGLLGLLQLQTQLHKSEVESYQRTQALMLLEDMANAEITDAEIDSLLRAAQQELFTDKILNSEGKVDAMALLTEVEEELDDSFRDQIFEALKQGYLKVRTAVADRNN